MSEKRIIHIAPTLAVCPFAECSISNTARYVDAIGGWFVKCNGCMTRGPQRKSKWMAGRAWNERRSAGRCW